MGSLACGACNHADRQAIESAIIEGRSVVGIGREFGVGRNILSRHRDEHMDMGTNLGADLDMDLTVGREDRGQAQGAEGAEEPLDIAKSIRESSARLGKLTGVLERLLYDSRGRARKMTQREADAFFQRSRVFLLAVKQRTELDLALARAVTDARGIDGQAGGHLLLGTGAAPGQPEQAESMESMEEQNAMFRSKMDYLMAHGFGYENAMAMVSYICGPQDKPIGLIERGLPPGWALPGEIESAEDEIARLRAEGQRAGGRSDQ